MPGLPRDLSRRRLFSLGLGAIALPLAGCKTTETVAVRLVYPPPPNQPRFVFETMLASARDVETVRGETSLRDLALGTDPKRQNVFIKPLDVAARFGRVYVSDSAGQVVHVFDAARRRYFRLGFRREGKLRRPAGLAVDAAGKVYVADTARRAVVTFDAFGLYQGLLSTPKPLNRPVAIAIGGGRVYVVDNPAAESDAHGLSILAEDGTPIRTLASRGTGPGQFNLPAAVGVGRDGSVYVLDAGNFRVQRLSPDGDFLSTWGGVGNRPGQFARPRDLATDADGNVFVSDAAFGNIQMFDPDGRLLMDLGRFGPLGGPGEFPMIAGIGIDETGRIYAVDQVASAVSVFAPWSRLAGTAA